MKRRFFVTTKERNGMPTLAITDRHGNVYAGTDIGSPDYADKLLEIVSTAYQAGYAGLESGGFMVNRQDKAYLVVGISTGTKYAGVSKGLFGFNKKEANRLLEIVAVAHGVGSRDYNEHVKYSTDSLAM